MKLDKIAFARLINYIGRQFAITLGDQELHDIDEIVNIDVPAPEVVRPDISAVGELLSAIKKGQKIYAIKTHRALTGYGLKESKDIIEANWPNSNSSYQQNMLDCIECQRQNKNLEPFILSRFNEEELDVIEEFIKSFYTA